MNKEEIMKTFLQAFGMDDPTISESEIIKRAFSNKSLHNKFDKIADIILIMGQIEFAKGEKSGMIEAKKITTETGVIS